MQKMRKRTPAQQQCSVSRVLPHTISARAVGAAGSATTTVCQSLETAACALWRCGINSRAGWGSSARLVTRDNPQHAFCSSTSGPSSSKQHEQEQEVPMTTIYFRRLWSDTNQQQDKPAAGVVATACSRLQHDATAGSHAACWDQSQLLHMQQWPLPHVSRHTPGVLPPAQPPLPPSLSPAETNLGTRTHVTRLRRAPSPLPPAPCQLVLA